MSVRLSIYDAINTIAPLDALEEQHKNIALEWVQSAADLFRIQKPNIPSLHLVSYFSILNREKNKVLLGHHKAADLWLPSGGHVEVDEHPQDTVKRECIEELGIEADFVVEDPVFITVKDVNDQGVIHTDISLWYVLSANEYRKLNFCHSEYKAIRWFDFSSIPYTKTDQHMMRFINKLLNFLFLASHSKFATYNKGS